MNAPESTAAIIVDVSFLFVVVDNALRLFATESGALIHIDNDDILFAFPHGILGVKMLFVVQTLLLQVA